MERKMRVLDKLAVEKHTPLHETYKKMDDETYGHLVLSHGFMEFLLASGVEEWIDTVAEWKVKIRYMFNRYCKVNGVAPERIEEGWKQFIED